MTTPSRTGARTSAVTSVRPDPQAWQHALRLADGNPRRLTVHPDGSVTVTNSAVR